jgi:hypothetical protein
VQKLGQQKKKNSMPLLVWHGVVSYRGTCVPLAPHILNGGNPLPGNTSTYLSKYRASFPGEVL